MNTEKKLTVLQQFLENIRKEHGLSFSNNVVNNYLEKEKQQIIDVCINTTQDCWASVSEQLNINLQFTEEDLKNQKKEAEQYFNETFKK